MGIEPAARELLTELVELVRRQVVEIGLAQLVAGCRLHQLPLLVIDIGRPGGEIGFTTSVAAVVVTVLIGDRAEGDAPLIDKGAGHTVAGDNGDGHLTVDQIHRTFGGGAALNGREEPGSRHRFGKAVNAGRYSKTLLTQHTIVVIWQGIIQREVAQRAGDAEILDAIGLGINGNRDLGLGRWCCRGGGGRRCVCGRRGGCRSARGGGCRRACGGCRRRRSWGGGWGRGGNAAAGLQTQQGDRVGREGIGKRTAAGVER